MSWDHQFSWNCKKQSKIILASGKKLKWSVHDGWTYKRTKTVDKHRKSGAYGHHVTDVWREADVLQCHVISTVKETFCILSSTWMFLQGLSSLCHDVKVTGNLMNQTRNPSSCTTLWGLRKGLGWLFIQVFHFLHETWFWTFEKLYWMNLK
jgi:hypothetical protein